MHNSLFSHLTILYDASFFAASISRYLFSLTPTYHDATVSFFLLYRFIFFFLYKLLRHCDIQVSLRLTILISASRVYASHRRAIYKPSMTHLYKLSK